MTIWRKKKPTLGMQPKARSRDEVNREYQSHAIQAGHKSRMILENEDLTARLNREVQEHIQTMRQLDNEYQASPAPAAPAEPAKEEG